MHEDVDILGGISRRGEPTSGGPGSERKIRVMIERAARKEPLFHPLDGLLTSLQPPLPPEENLNGRQESA